MESGTCHGLIIFLEEGGCHGMERLKQGFYSEKRPGELVVVAESDMGVVERGA